MARCVWHGEDGTITVWPAESAAVDCPPFPPLSLLACGSFCKAVVKGPKEIVAVVLTGNIGMGQCSLAVGTWRSWAQTSC